jgi:hypothetical protein
MDVLKNIFFSFSVTWHRLTAKSILALAPIDFHLYSGRVKADEENKKKLWLHFSKVAKLEKIVLKPTTTGFVDNACIFFPF